MFQKKQKLISEAFLYATVMWGCVSLRPPESETLVSTAGGRETSGCRQIVTRHGVLYISTKEQRVHRETEVNI